MKIENLALCQSNNVSFPIQKENYLQSSQAKWYIIKLSTIFFLIWKNKKQSLLPERNAGISQTKLF